MIEKTKNKKKHECMKQMAASKQTHIPWEKKEKKKKITTKIK